MQVHGGGGLSGAPVRERARLQKTPEQRESSYSMGSREGFCHGKLNSITRVGVGEHTRISDVIHR